MSPTVIAYQIVQAKYNTSGFVGYEVVDENLGIADAQAPTAAEITALAKRTDVLANLTSIHLDAKTTTGENNETVLDLNADGTVDYSASLKAGYWLVLVTGAVDTVYNPMLLGVYYKNSGSDNTMEGGALDSTGNWTLDSDAVYAKSTKPSIDKQIVDKDGKTTADYDVAMGDTVYFQIDTAIPSYSAEYTDATVTITDALDEGFKLNQDSIKVYVVEGEGESETKTEIEAANYSIEEKNDRGFQVKFTSNYVLGAGNGKRIRVQYHAELTENANWNFKPNTNTATLEYTNHPDTDSDDRTGSSEDKTYSYTFAIDAELYGPGYEDKPWNEVTNELMKGETIRKTTEVDGVVTTTEEFKALAGAEFTLTNDITKKTYTAISGDDGKLTFKGLDAGSYTLVETKAPNGYTLNAKETAVVITASYNDEGKLESYDITFDGERKTVYTASNQTIDGETDLPFTKVDTAYQKWDQNENKWVEITLEEAESLVEILNTKIASLPSTGGIGTTIFTIGGCAIMVIAAGLFFATRRKAEK